MGGFSYAAAPPEVVHAVVQDHGPDDGGWGPATVLAADWPWPKPLITTRTNPETIAFFESMARKVARETGKPTRLVRFRLDEELLRIGGSS